MANPTRFHCHTKVANRFRSGRVLLAGDAAHVCSPAEGHGMNTGLHDAANLAWKLALVCHDVASPALLDSYEAERRPVAVKITRSGDAAEHAQTLTDPAERDDRDRSMRAVFADPASRHHEVVAEAELDVAYTDSPVVAGDTNPHLSPGDRLPDTIATHPRDSGPRRLHDLVRGAGHAVLALGGRTGNGAELADLLTRLHEITDSSAVFTAVIGLGTNLDGSQQLGQLDPAAAELLGVDGITVLAVRPDGFIGLRADSDHVSRLSHYDALVRTGAVSHGPC